LGTKYCSCVNDLVTNAARGGISLSQWNRAIEYDVAYWPRITKCGAAIGAFSVVKRTSGEQSKSVACEPLRHFATVNCRIAKKLFVLVRHGVLLVVGAPGQLRSLAGAGATAEPFH
jgi:hypothetical protein